ADESELARDSAVRKAAFAPAQQEWIESKHDLVDQSLLEQRGRQRRASTNEQIRAVLRSEAPNSLHDVRAKVLDWAPFEAIRPVRCDVFRRRVQVVREWAALHLRPEARPEIVGAAAKEQIEVFPLCLGPRLCSSRCSIRCRPPTARGVAVFFGLD